MTAMTAVSGKCIPHLKPHETIELGQKNFWIPKRPLTIDAVEKPKLKKKVSKKIWALNIDASKTAKLEKNFSHLINLPSL